MKPQLPGKPGLDLTEVGLERLMNLPVESVYGASRYEQKVTEARLAVSIVTADEIAKSQGTGRWPKCYRTSWRYVSYDRNYSYLGSAGSIGRGTTAAGSWCWSTGIASTRGL